MPNEPSGVKGFNCILNGSLNFNFNFAAAEKANANALVEFYKPHPVGLVLLYLCFPS